MDWFSLAWIFGGVLFFIGFIIWAKIESDKINERGWKK